MSPRTGRPTDNPKGKPITIRLDNEAKTILDSYCLQENVDKGEAVRRGAVNLVWRPDDYSVAHTKGVYKIIVSLFGVVVKHRKEIFYGQIFRNHI